VQRALTKLQTKYTEIDRIGQLTKKKQRTQVTLYYGAELPVKSPSTEEQP